MKSLESIISEEVATAVEQIVRASRAAAIAAFEQRFDELTRQSQQQGSKPEQNKLHGMSGGKRATGSRRPPRSVEEIETLETQFLSVVRSNPGLGLAALASKVGVGAGQLRVPVVRLKAKRQLRLVGQGKHACYFPVEEGIAA